MTATATAASGATAAAPLVGASVAAASAMAAAATVAAASPVRTFAAAPSAAAAAAPAAAAPAAIAAVAAAAGAQGSIPAARALPAPAALALQLLVALVLLLALFSVPEPFPLRSRDPLSSNRLLHQLCWRALSPRWAMALQARAKTHRQAGRQAEPARRPAESQELAAAIHSRAYDNHHKSNSRIRHLLPLPLQHSHSCTSRRACICQHARAQSGTGAGSLGCRCGQNCSTKRHAVGPVDVLDGGWPAGAGCQGQHGQKPVPPSHRRTWVPQRTAGGSAAPMCRC